MVHIEDSSGDSNEWLMYDECYVGTDGVVLRVVQVVDGTSFFTLQNDAATAKFACQHFGFSGGRVFTSGATNDANRRYKSSTDNIRFLITGAAGSSLQDILCYYGDVDNDCNARIGC